MQRVRHSKQRDAIKAYLLSTTSHPTAEAVYEPVSYTHLDVYKRQQ